MPSTEEISGFQTRFKKLQEEYKDCVSHIIPVYCAGHWCVLSIKVRHWKVTNSILDLNSKLDKLKPFSSPRYGTEGCLPETRQGILGEVMSWVEEDAGRNCVLDAWSSWFREDLCCLLSGSEHGGDLGGNIFLQER